MSGIDQITYRARNGSAGIIYEAATSLRDQAGSERWLRRLEPWLRAGRPQGRAYLNFGPQAAFLRWYAEAGSQFDWQYALALVGQPDVLAGGYALELPDSDLATLQHASGQAQLTRTARGPLHDTVEAVARSADAIELLVPLLAHALRDERRVAMPWPGPSLPEAVMWGLVSILEMIGDARPVSFFTYVSSPIRDPDTPGLFVSFRPDARTVPPDPGFEALADGLAAMFADGPDQLRQTLADHGMLEPADQAGRVGRLLHRWPTIQAENARTGGTTTVNASFDRPAPGRYAGAVPQPGTSVPPPGTARSGGFSQQTPGQAVICPMCLEDLPRWDTLDYWRWDTSLETYVELPVPPGLGQRRLDQLLYGAYVRCPASHGDEQIGPHYLPADYGRFGSPVVLGFVGLTKSGKSHLLASMVGAIVAHELEKTCGIQASPLDQAWHRRYMDAWVSPLLKQRKVLPGTREDRVAEFADAFIMKRPDGQEQVVALFDVAGGDLARLNETKEFLWIANGLFFVIDPERLSAQWAEDETFSNVLDIVRKGARQPVSAAIVLNKADMVRFEEPVDRWLRYEGSASKSGALDWVEFLRESADVYAYLDAKNARAMAAPYEVCDRATLHVASPTGGADTGDDIYPRGVKPRRVLRPLVAMLAMTGVLTGPEAEKVGV
jgi:hypothetical protein